MSSTARQAATWLRIGLLCLAGVSTGSHGQALTPSPCEAGGAATQEGFFALRVGDASIGLPATVQALSRAGESPFAAIVVPSGMRAAVPPGARDRSPTFLPASPVGSGSALVHGGLSLSVERIEWKAAAISVVMYKPAGGDAHPVAAMVVDSSEWRTKRVLLTWLSLPDTVRPAPGLDLARDGHLYTMALLQDAEALYCVSSSSGNCDGGPSRTQGEALQRIALHRECALAAQPPSARVDAPRWRVVTISAQEALPGARARVSARVSDQDKPLAGVQLVFSRLPHSACTATTQGDGTATCELSDAQGHEGGHPEFDREPVLVTFPGDLRGNPILLPTTRLMATEGGAPQSLRMR